ncbi:hypothetical protein [Flavobacterium sp. JAS]|uniref:hypothetical protein n=1 Tax=Flavobacterium sp. JAS TaxID=2897329 RepID=UPI001E305626|nr:hypothetical protein [Flavobacterium sp. JAS]
MSNTNSILSEADLEIIKKQGQGSFPIKKSAVIFFVLIWNLLLLWSFIPIFTNPQEKGFSIGIGANIALGFVFLSSISALISKSFRTLILKEGRNFEDIKKFLYFIILVTGMLFISFTVARFN